MSGEAPESGPAGNLAPASAPEPSPMRRGEICRFEIDCWSSSNAFRRGHRIRVEITSSNYPQFDRNPNTGHPFGLDAQMRPATQTVYHGPRHSSCILLPVVDAPLEDAGPHAGG